MRLLRTEDLKFEEVHDIENVSYAILSHTWIPGQELSLEALHNEEHHGKLGYKKIWNFCQLVREEYKLDYVWVDTVCIDKSNNTEFSKSINCKFL
jgi:hypothetical protein